MSDCWKAYNILSQNYIHLKVNHSMEFVHENGDHTNKIEGHWRHAKLVLPSFGARKNLFASYVDKFTWGYEHKEDGLFETIMKNIPKTKFENV